MVLYFCCGAYIVSDNKDIIVRISHDEMLEVYYKDFDALAQGKIEYLNAVLKDLKT